MSNEIVESNFAAPTGVAAEIVNIGKGASDYISIVGDDFDTRLDVLDATTNSEPIVDHLNKVIELENVIIHRVELADEETGTIDEAARTILIDKSGKAYHAISSVLFRDIQRMIAVLGEPHTWPAPVKIKIKQVQQGKNRMYKMERVK